MNIGTFEAMDQKEMMEVNGGARSRSAKESSSKGCKKKFFS